jgi:hypothetical protein
MEILVINQLKCVNSHPIINFGGNHESTSH